MRTLIILLLLAGSALAQDAWDAPELKLEALEAALESASAEKDRPEAVERARQLKRLIDILSAGDQLPDVESAPERLAAAKQEQESLEAETAESTPQKVRSEVELEEVKRAWNEASSAQKAEAKAFDHISGQLTALEAEAKKLPEMVAESRRRLSAAGEATDPYLMANLKLQVRADEERQRHVTEALAAWRAEKPVAALRLEIVKVREERTRRISEAAAAKWTEEVKRQAEVDKDAVAREAEAADRSGDVMKKFRTQVKQKIVSLDADTSIMKSRLPLWKTQIATEEGALSRFERLNKNLTSKGAKTSISPQTAKLLRLTRKTLLSRERLLTGSRIPQLKKEQSENQRMFAELQQEMLRIEEPPEESLEYRELVDSLGEGKEEQALTAWRSHVQGQLSSATRAQSALLDQVEAYQARLEELYDRQLVEIRTLVDLISSELYFVRSNETLGAGTLREAWDDLRKLVFDLKTGADRTIAQELLLLIGLGLFAVVIAPLLLGLLRKHLRLDPNQPMKPDLWSMLLRLLRLAFLAALLPLVLLILSAALASVEEAGHLEAAVRVWLESAALALFIYGFLREILRGEGPLVTRWRLSAAVAEQILGSIRIYTYSYVLLVIPARIGRELYQLDALPRLMETAFYALMVWAMFRLVIRRRPLIQTWIGTSGTLYRMWILIGPAIGAVLLVILALDIAGYRVGATYLFHGVVRTYAVVLFLSIAYRVFAKGFRRLVDRTLLAQQAEGVKARQISDSVMQELTRVMGFVLIVVTLLVLGDAWEFGGYLGSFLGNLVIAQFHDGTVLSVLDILTAALWIGGAHFIVHNLSGVLEFMVYPLIEEDEKGGRYVLLTLSRYAILLVGYSAAFLALNFNFQSLSVVLAAFSVGIGFGLQEIIGNFISGLILLIERPVRVGDTITVGTTGGSVEKITIRATIVTSWDNQQIIVPNKNFITQNVTNWTRNNDITRRKVPVSLAQSADIERARVIMEEILANTTGVLKEPAPNVLFQNFGESQLDFEIWFHCHIGVGFGLMTQVRFEVLRRFREEGIELAVPRRRIETEE